MGNGPCDLCAAPPSAAPPGSYFRVEANIPADRVTVEAHDADLRVVSFSTSVADAETLRDTIRTALDAAAPRTPTPGAGILCPHIADLGHEDGACSECYGEAVQLLARERSRRARVEEALRMKMAEYKPHDPGYCAACDAARALLEEP